MNTPLSLSSAETRDLAKLEARIHKGLSHFIDVGKALLEIHSRRLYKDRYESFAAYCEARWNINRTHGYRLMHASEVAEQVSPFGDTLPTHETQMRPLIGQPVEVQQAAWANATAGGHEPTEQEVQQALEDLPVEKKAERIKHDEARANQRIREDGEKARRRQAESLINRVLKMAEGFPETGEVAEVYFRAGLQALLAADDPEMFLPLQALVPQVATAIGEAA